MQEPSNTRAERSRIRGAIVDIHSADEDSDVGDDKKRHNPRLPNPLLLLKIVRSRRCSAVPIVPPLLTTGASHRCRVSSWRRSRWRVAFAQYIGLVACLERWMDRSVEWMWSDDGVGEEDDSEGLDFLQARLAI